MKTSLFRNRLLTGAAVLLISAGAAVAQDEKQPANADTVLATVNGEAITLGNVAAARGTLPDKYASLPDDVLLPGLLEQLIQQTVLGQSAGELSRRAQFELENERRAILATQALEAIVSSAVDDEKIQAAYEEQYAHAAPVKEWNASHILVKTEDEAKAIIEELNNGADFAELAKEKSVGPSGPNGGALGWFGPGMMVKPFEKAVAEMEDGAIAGPVQTQFGWHVIKLNESRMKGAPKLDEVKADIVQKLQSDAVDKAIAGLLDSANIERTDLGGIDPSLLSDPSLFE